MSQQQDPTHKALRRVRLPEQRRARWPWLVLLVLVVGIAALFLKNPPGPDPKNQAMVLVEQMKAAASGMPMGEPLFGELPKVQRDGKDVTVTLAHVPPKICVLASWELYRVGSVAVNGKVPTRVSSSKWVDLCNEEATAILTWSPH